MKELLRQAAERSIRCLENQDGRPVFPNSESLALLEQLVSTLPEDSTDPQEVLRVLDDYGSNATVVSTGGRYFGFVTGGVLPAALAANWLAGAWDQPADMYIASPVAVRLEQIAKGWLLEVLGLPTGSGVGLVTGATMANFCGLAAARHALLKRRGWDVEARGLFGAPELSVVVSDEVHVSVLKALSMLGLGRERVVRIPTDEQGRLRPEHLQDLTDLSIVCLQAGNVNTGAFDPAAEVCTRARQAGAWTHVDGAFGLWASASPQYAHLTTGCELADSWAVDGHKWLNVPYDSGMVVCRSEEDLRAALSYSAAYLVHGAGYEPGLYTPEMSRRGRGIEVWAALLSLGRTGLADLIERSCRHARRFAEELAANGFEVLNEVVLNQVLVSFGEDQRTLKVIEGVQSDGTCWCGGGLWKGRRVMRISVSSWATTEADVERSLAAILRIAGKS